MKKYGQIIILNGAPRSGKSSIAAEIMRTFDSDWINIGVDSVMRETPKSKLPGIGLRPGGERPDLEPYVVNQYQCMYRSITEHSRAGKNVVVDVGHHDNYSQPYNILRKCRAMLDGLPVLWVGVHCPIDVIMERRNLGSDDYLKSSNETPIPAPVQRWQEAVHLDVVYDLDVDTSTLNPVECTEIIRKYLAGKNQHKTFMSTSQIDNAQYLFCPNSAI